MMMANQKKYFFSLIICVCLFTPLSISNAANQITNFYFHKKISETTIIVFKEGKETLIIQPVLQSAFQTNLYFFILPSVPDYYGNTDILPILESQKSTAPRFFSNFTSLFNPERMIYNSTKKYPHLRTDDYNFYVLFPSDESEFNMWLSDYNLPALAKNTVTKLKGYFSNDEPIIAISFLAKIEEPSSLTPIKISFSVSEPIYPLPLSFDDNSYHIDLYVIADSAVNVEGLTTHYCDVFQLKENFVGKYSGMVIKEKQLSSYMWDGCVISHLSGKIPLLTVNNSRIKIHPKRFKAYQECLFSKKLAFTLSVSISIIIFLALLILAKEKQSDLICVYFGIIIATSLLIGYLIYDSLPKPVMETEFILQ